MIVSVRLRRAERTVVAAEHVTSWRSGVASFYRVGRLELQELKRDNR